jgi:hypothetical protein
VIAPAGVGGGATAARVCAVDDIVVDERGAVNHFDDRAQGNGSAALVAAGSGGEQKQSGTKALAAAFAKIAADFSNGLDGLPGLRGDFAFDQGKVLANQIKNLAYG